MRIVQGGGNTGTTRHAGIADDERTAIAEATLDAARRAREAAGAPHAEDESRTGSREAGAGAHAAWRREPEGAIGDTTVMEALDVTGGTRKWSPRLPHIGHTRVIAVTLPAVTAAYVTGVVFFSTHFVPGTRIGGVDVGMCDTAQAASRINEAVDSMQIHVSGGGVDVSIDAKDIGLTADGAQDAENAMRRQDAATWFSSAVSPKDHPSETMRTNDAATQEIANIIVDQANSGTQMPSDAHVEIKDDGSVSIVPEQDGNAIDVDKATRAISEAVSDAKDAGSQHVEVSLDEECRATPKVTSDDPRLVDEANVKRSACAGRDVKVSVDGTEVADMTPDVLSKMMTVEDGKATFDTEAVDAWVDGNVLPRLSQMQGSIGWSVDTEALKADIRQAILDGGRQQVGVGISQAGLSTFYCQWYGGDWTGHAYWGSTIADAGCGLVSTTHAVNILTGHTYTPVEMYDLRAEYGCDQSTAYGANGVCGMDESKQIASDFLRDRFNIVNEEIPSTTDAYAEQLSKGDRVILFCIHSVSTHDSNGGDWHPHPRGHFLIAYAYDPDTQTFKVRDSSHKQGADCSYTWSQMSTLVGNVSGRGSHVLRRGTSA